MNLVKKLICLLALSVAAFNAFADGDDRLFDQEGKLRPEVLKRHGICPEAFGRNYFGRSPVDPARTDSEVAELERARWRREGNRWVRRPESRGPSEQERAARLGITVEELRRLESGEIEQD